MAMNADPTETKNPIAKPASDIVLETLRGLKSVPESGLLKTSASPSLPNPTYIPAEIRTTPKTRENTASASNLAGLAKTWNGTSFHPARGPCLSGSEPEQRFLFTLLGPRR